MGRWWPPEDSFSEYQGSEEEKEKMKESQSGCPAPLLDINAHTDLFLPLSLPFNTMSNDLGLEKSIIDQPHSYNSMGHPLRSNSLFVHSLLSKDSFQMEVLNTAWW